MAYSPSSILKVTQFHLSMATQDKYDRQLRLWGAAGQRALGNTLVVLVGSSACGTESLKNLVLPGVGSILVVDDDEFATTNGSATPTVKASPELTESMLKFSSQSASNFFLPPPTTYDEGDKKSSNSAQACALLSELNPDVNGYYCTVPSLEGVDYTSFLKALMENPPTSSDDAASSSSATPKKLLVIAADQPSTVTLPISHACHVHSIPLINVRSYGLLGYVRIQTASPYHAITEAKPAHRIPDLRLSAWPLFDGLNKVTSSVMNLDEMEDTKDHSHVPFVVILLQAMDKWRLSVGAPVSSDIDASTSKPRYPASFAEKEDFRKIVRGMAKNINNEINFEEALREAHLTWGEGRISEDVKMVLDRVDEESFFSAAIKSEMEVEGDSSSPITPPHVLQFQLLALALKRFLKVNDNYPPLEGTIPDMTSDTTRYVALQEAYKQQAEKDKSSITELVKTLLDECKQKSNGCDLRVTMPADDEILTFCKNSRYLRILETRPLFAEYKLQDPTSPVVLELAKTLSSSDMPQFDTIQADARDDLMSATFDPYETDPVQTPMLWWIALRACDAFYDRHQHYPGKHDQELALEADANEVYKCMVDIAGSLGLAECDFIKEHLLDQTKGKDLAREVVRYDEGEIHNIAAVVGGVASQEAVKLITGQYVPFDDTYVYNGIASTAGVYRF